MDRMSGAGFRYVLNYSSWYGSREQILALADQAAAAGMQLIWPLNHPAWRDSGELATVYPKLAQDCGCQDNAELRRYAVSLVKDHPATWGYYVGDEQLPSQENVDRILSLAQEVRQTAPGKPTLFVTLPRQDLEANLAPFLPAADFGGTDYYPVGLEPNLGHFPSIAAEHRRVVRAHGASSAMVLQSFSWSQYYPETYPEARFPTLAVIRNMKLKNGKRPSMDLYGHNAFDPRFPNIKEGAIGKFRGLNDLDTLWKEIRKAYGKQKKGRPKRIFVSEWTIQSDHDSGVFAFHVSREQQARYITKAFKLVRKLKYVDTLGWFSFYDYPDSATNPAWGLMTYEGAVKPSFGAYPGSALGEARGRGRANKVALRQQLGHLHRVGGGSLAQVVADDPEVEAALVRGVAADAADQHIVAALDVDRQRIGALARIVDHDQARGSREQLAAVLRAQLALGLDVDRLRVPGDDGDPHASGRDADRLRQAEDLAGLAHHLALLGRVVVARLELLHLRQDVEGDPVGEDLDRGPLAVQQRARLGP